MINEKKIFNHWLLENNSYIFAVKFTNLWKQHSKTLLSKMGFS